MRASIPRSAEGARRRFDLGAGVVYARRVSSKPAPIDAEAARRFVARHPAWSLRDGALHRRLRFSSYADGLGFAVALGLTAERRDHHPELHVAWGSVGVVWSTHDVGGLSELDLELALETDRLAARHGAEGP